jgi:DNA-binding transcriptional regulator YdaS (Cro superfamily)
MGKHRKKRPAGLTKAIKAAGGLSSLARLLDITPQSIIKWTKIPRKRIVSIEQLTGVPRELLAPELYRAP